MQTFVKTLVYTLVLAVCVFLLVIFGQPLFQELKYSINKSAGFKYRLAETDSQGVPVIPPSENIRYIAPPDKDYSIVIPKIGATAKIFSDIDPYNESEFLPILRMGIAQARETSLPGRGGKIFLFSHSTDAFYNAGRYNAVFYLINKLEAGDEIDIFYQGDLYKYKVIETRTVSPVEVDYKDSQNKESLVLMTCYPSGTTLKRILVTAEPF